MILYLDTSALVKLYVSEAGSKLVHKQVDFCDVVASSIVAYPETISALNRAYRDQRLTESNYQTLTDQVRREWDSFLEIQLDQSLKQRAGELVESEGLRGFDSIHLASAMVLREEVETFKFACFDERLRRAAKRQELNCAH